MQTQSINLNKLDSKSNLKKNESLPQWQHITSTISKMVTNKYTQKEKKYKKPKLNWNFLQSEIVNIWKCEPKQKEEKK